MNRIQKLFAEADRPVLSVYFCAGHPTFDSTLPVLEALDAAGVRMVEIGIPFSDPMADGPVILDAATKALRNGMTLRRLFSQLRDVRAHTDMPLILMGYLNPIMQYGFEAFCRSCQECGIDGAIIPDLPYEEYVATYKPTADAYGLDMIMLITPETDDERIRLIDSSTNGFIYMVSSPGTTGAKDNFDSQREYFERVAAMPLRNPRMIGFGISNRATYEAAASHAAGVIVGSRFIQLLDSCPTPTEAARKLVEMLGA